MFLKQMLQNVQKILKYIFVFLSFPCGRWLGKSIDDGSIERLLVAELVPAFTDHAGKV